MSDYVVYDGSQVINVIIADDKDHAEELSGHQCFDVDEISRTIEVLRVDESGTEYFIEEKLVPGIGWTIENNEWLPPKPGDNFYWNGQQWCEIIDNGLGE